MGYEIILWYVLESLWNPSRLNMQWQKSGSDWSWMSEANTWQARYNWGDWGWEPRYWEAITSHKASFRRWRRDILGLESLIELIRMRLLHIRWWQRCKRPRNYYHSCIIYLESLTFSLLCTIVYAHGSPLYIVAETPQGCMVRSYEAGRPVAQS
jgi:hypothetical protein